MQILLLVYSWQITIFLLLMKNESVLSFVCLFIEFQAYASYMKGSLLFEQDQNWDVALMNFKSAR